jgi:hypothetical protein
LKAWWINTQVLKWRLIHIEVFEYENKRIRSL